MQIGGIQSVSDRVSATKASTSVAYDPRDTNQDGVVSATEALVYALAHPDLSVTSTSTSTSTTTSTASSQYDATGALKTSAGSRAQFDQYA